MPGRLTFQIPESDLWAKLAELFRSTPLPIVAQRLGVPQIAYLDELTPSQPSAKCSDVLKLYLDRNKQCDQGTIRRLRISWNDFVKHTQGRTMRDVTQEGVDRWEKWLFSAGHGPSTIKAYRGRVTCVIRHAIRKGLDTENSKRALALIEKIDLPDVKGSNDPNPISVEDFHKLLDKADVKWQVILLLMLNCAFYGEDVRMLPLSAIDLKKGTMTFRREKTSMPRVAMLWKETVQAIKAYMKVRPSAKGALILSNHGAPFSYSGLERSFRTLRKRAGVKVTLNQFRDGAFTEACQVDERAAKVIAGHSNGMSDRYVMRAPSHTKAAVDAIREHYRIARLVKQKSARCHRRGGRTSRDS